MSIFQNVEKKLQHRNERQVFTFKHLKAAKQFLDYEPQKGFYTVWLVKTAEIFTIIELHLKYLILESLNYLIKIQINYEPKFYSILFDLGQNILGFFQHLSFQLFLATFKILHLKWVQTLKNMIQDLLNDLRLGILQKKETQEKLTKNVDLGGCHKSPSKNKNFDSCVKKFLKIVIMYLK